MGNKCLKYGQMSAFQWQKIVLSIIKVVELQTPEPKSIEEGVCGHQVYLHIVLNKHKSLHQ